MGVRTWWTATVATVAVLLLSGGLLTGCDSGGSHGVAPKTWARHVCTALKPWSSTISDLTAKTQREMSQVKTPDQAKVTIVDLLDDEARASGQARDKLLAAGVPDVDNGKKIAAEFSTALDSARTSYTTARDTIRKLPTNNSTTFYQGVTDAIDKLNRQYSAGALDTSKVRSADLQKAFDEVPECQ